MVRKNILCRVALLLMAALASLAANAQEGEIGAMPYFDEFGDPIAMPPPPPQQEPPVQQPPPPVPEPEPVAQEPYYEDYPPQEFVQPYEEPPPPPQPVRPVVRPAPRATPGATGIRPPQPRQPRQGGPALPRPSETAGLNAKSADNGEAMPDELLKPTDPVSFDFRDEPLYNVIEGISRLTGRNFDVDPNIAATTVTIITHEEIPPELAYEVLESILATRGFSLVETLEGKLVKIISTPDATQSEKTPLVRGSQIISERYDDYATHIISVQYGDAAEISNALKLLGSRNSRIDVYAPTNTLIITDTTDGLKRIFSFLEEVDIPGFDTVMEIFTLEYTRAEVISQQLEQVLLDAAGPPTRGQQMPQPQPVRPTPTRAVRPTVPGVSTSQVIGSRQETLRMVPDERLNALIVMASEGMMERVRDMVKRLDTPTPYEANNLHIYELLNADAEQVEQAIQPLVGTAPRGRAGGGGQAGAVPGGGGAVAEVQPFEQKVQVTRYDQTNSLLIVASPQDYKLLEAFIARLDVPQRQVLVEVIVMDVTISDDYGVTVDAAGITGNDGFGLTNTANIAKLATGLGTAADAANQIVGGPGATLALGLLGLGAEGGMTAGVFDDIEVEISGKKVKVPFVPLLFQAIEKVSDLEVLSQPSLVTVDNEEASIVVGQEVPFITATSRPAVNQQGEISGGAYGYGTTRVQREEVGVKLKVTPQISEGDNVLLQIEVEVSDTDADQIGTVDILGPTTNKSLIQNRVLVKDGSTAVLAGLIRDSVSRSRKQPPVLGDLPGLGWLFRSKTSRREKRNMVVLVTPHIVKEGIDLDRVTQYKVNEYHDANIEELLKTSFFKRVSTKRDLRKNYRPTFDRSEAMTGRRGTSNYGRGDIKR